MIRGNPTQINLAQKLNRIATIKLYMPLGKASKTQNNAHIYEKKLHTNPYK